jgi:DNA-directed RNA polymerase alpha subunit
MGEEGARRSPKRLLWRRIEELELPLRPLNVLHGAGIVALADLVRRSEAELGVMKNLGKKDVRLLQEKLLELGLRLGMVRARRPRSVRSMRRERSSKV